jgi:hypothetical protein
MNSDGWGAASDVSLPVTIGVPKIREKPPAPPPPKLVALENKRFKVSWSIPQACPPVEASQLQLTDLGRGKKWLVEAATGRLVEAGKTTFTATRLEATVNAEDGVEYAAAVCCRNAEGFGEYSIDSDSAINAASRSGSGMELVLAVGAPTSEVPALKPLGEGRMQVKWVLPGDAKATNCMLRRVGDNNWYLWPKTPIQAPECQVVATGLEEGIEYEAKVAFIANGRSCGESPVSRPACIGELKKPGVPVAPKEPRLLVVDAERRHMRIKWQTLTAVPPVTGTVVKFRPLGARFWKYVHHSTCQLVEEEPEPVPSPAIEVDLLNMEPGVRYEAAVSFRNKLGKGPDSPLSDPVCIGRPNPKYLKCTNCGCDYDLQHAEYSKSAEHFWCPVCRFRQMDPFNAVVEPYGILLCHILMRGQLAFSLDLPDLKAWRKDDQAIFMRMVKIDSDNCAQVWPRKLSFEANGSEVFCIKEPEEGHVRRDVPKDIAAGLRPGMNTINITLEDDHLTGYAMCLVRTETKTANQLADETPPLEEDEARDRVMRLLGDYYSSAVADDEEEDEITCVISNKLKLRCPLSFERVVIPVRGDKCAHLQCFGLGAYLESNMKMRAVNNRWTCPVCTNSLKPSDLRVDTYVKKVLEETPPSVDEVEILQDGSYRCIEEVPEGFQPARPDPDAEAAEAAAAAAEKDDAIQELPTTIEVGEGGLKRRQPTPAVLSRKQRRRQRMMEVGANENDSD